MSEALKVEVRQTRGKRHARRMRSAGQVPAVLYGHGEQNLSLSASADQLQIVMRHGARVVDLEGAVSEKAFICDLQWDVFGLEVLHLDLARVSADEKVEVELPVELRGEAPGAKEGGVVTQTLHHVRVECLVTSIPEKLSLRIHGLGLGQSLLVSDLELPAGATMITEADAQVVQCAEPKAESEAGDLSADGAEPEVIGRKAGDEEDEEG